MNTPVSGCPYTPPPQRKHTEPVPLYGDSYHGNPDLWQELREQIGPVVQVELEPRADEDQEPLTAWLLLDYNTNLSVLTNPLLYTKDSRGWPALTSGRLSPASPLYAFAEWRPNAFFVDGDEHARLRSPITAALDAYSRRQVNRDVGALADRMIDSFAHRGEVDLVGEYAQLIPLFMTTRLMGLSDEDGFEVAQAMSNLWQAGEKTVEAHLWLQQRLLDLAVEKRADPGDDVTSMMVQHENALTDAEVRDQLMLLFAAGHEPAKNAIANTLFMLLTKPEFRGALATSASLIRETLDQSMWLHPPLKCLISRYATRDVQLGGKEIRTGDALVLGFAPAHGDPALLGGSGESPYSLTATSRAHLMWGAGPHKCPADTFAQHMVIGAIERLIDRIPDLRLAVPAEEVERNDSPWLAGITALPATFSPVRPAREAEPAADSDDAAPDGEPGNPPHLSSSVPSIGTSAPEPPAAERQGLWSRLNALARWLSRR
ncbi:cytochrome P450 [Allonocardiopsis opalescens]|uniref:Cytochrome P450 n=1 Tax=Allonocardiopsis opalescens TaxID=1144618 RepID=A0A2T0Q790_9ACTN|nr:cytochrome P450 [Allonocardiopsis opalescens]PRX99672.1 cytochrome P450 [Allonocardiopsis opalescens]